MTFTNVGNMGLENAPIVTQVTLKAGEEKVISGIPLGTVFGITEDTPTDGSSLESIAISPTTSGIAELENNAVQGHVTSDASEVTVTFKNTKRPMIDISMIKLWKDQNGQELTGTLPESITVQLQR